MTDQPAEPTVVDPVVPPPATGEPITPINNPVITEPGEPTKPVLGDAGKQAIDRMKAERDEALKRIKAIEDRDLSELDRFKRDNAEMQTRLAAAETEALRQRVARDKQVPPNSLIGATEAEMLASADDLLAWRGAAAATPGVPQPDPSQGARQLTPEAEESAEYDRYFPPGK